MGTPAGPAAEPPKEDARTDNSAVAQITAQDLVDEFKNNGSFDVVRNELLKLFTASRAGREFSERTRAAVSDGRHMALTSQNMHAYPLFQCLQISQAMREIENPQASTSSSSLHISPTRYGSVNKTRQANTALILKELEKHTAYERAEEDVRELITTTTRSLDVDLEVHMRKMEDQRKAKSDNTKPQNAERSADSKDVDMNID